MYRGLDRRSRSCRCSLEPEHGIEIGWKAKYAPEHILEAADAEVELILENLAG